MCKHQAILNSDEDGHSIMISSLLRLPKYNICQQHSLDSVAIHAHRVVKTHRHCSRLKYNRHHGF